MTLKVDQPFLNAIIELFASEALSEEQEKEMFNEDCKVTTTELKDEAIRSSASEQKNFYDELHISPLKVSL